MNSIYFKQRLKNLKMQRYKLLVTKYKITKLEGAVAREYELMEVVDKSLALVEAAIASTMRLITYTEGIENELKSYKIIDQNLQNVMHDYQLVSASTQVASRKIDKAGEDLAEFIPILKYKNKSH
ncbi:hypothetical protein RZE82_04805 [Mollicutes bacterium LVI A0039]|nr:hypothetical protein RZE82_04805 [Mollicutes bacterium LVI A0039]